MDELLMLKTNLEIGNDRRDEYLMTLLDAAEKELARQGIPAPEKENGDYPSDYLNLKVMYAAYYYRKRAEDVQAMPNMLRYARNNYLLKLKREGSQT